KISKEKPPRTSCNVCIAGGILPNMVGIVKFQSSRIPAKMVGNDPHQWYNQKQVPPPENLLNFFAMR
ncbi:MAG: hypothetical protein JSV36_13105, partial [Anaerolineae bacterium]